MEICFSTFSQFNICSLFILHYALPLYANITQEKFYISIFLLCLQIIYRENMCLIKFFFVNKNKRIKFYHACVLLWLAKKIFKPALSGVLLQRKKNYFLKIDINLWHFIFIRISLVDFEQFNHCTKKILWSSFEIESLSLMGCSATILDFRSVYSLLIYYISHFMPQKKYSSILLPFCKYF